MDSELVLDLLKHLIDKTIRLIVEFKEITDDRSYIYCLRVFRVMNLLAPIIAAVLVYHYLKYLLILNAYKYEEYVRKKCERVKKVTKQLKLLAKRYENFYFCYLPLNHGTVLPRTYSLFMAIKEVLMNSDRPATRALRMNLLKDLLRSNYSDAQDNFEHLEIRGREILNSSSSEDMDPLLLEFNLGIMKCSRELIIHGIKDFDVMTTVYRVLETVMEDSY